MKTISRAEAKALGLKKYFTGEPCGRGHIAERYVSSPSCVECKKESHRVRFGTDPEGHNAKSQEWYAANRERKRATSAAWLKANKERKKATNKAWYEANKERHRASVYRWIEANRERYDEAAREWAKANPDRVKARLSRYSKRHADKVNAKGHNRRARLKGNGGTHTADDVSWLLTKQKVRCAHSWCRASLKEGHHVDHIIPIKLGGRNDRKNLQLLCGPCNLRKSSTHPVDFAQANGLLL